MRNKKKKERKTEVKMSIGSIDHFEDFLGGITQQKNEVIIER